MKSLEYASVGFALKSLVVTGHIVYFGMYIISMKFHHDLKGQSS